MGTFLHELIPLELGDRHPGLWRREQSKDEKDLVYIPDSRLSVEIKTSSHRSHIFGNRSYAQRPAGAGKQRSGYFLTVNFAKFTAQTKPKILRIRFGWLDQSDWIGQAAPTGQQARLPPNIYTTKLLSLYDNLD